MREKQGPN